jgi:hypothetical protein
MLESFHLVFYGQPDQTEAFKLMSYFSLCSVFVTSIGKLLDYQK